MFVTLEEEHVCVNVTKKINRNHEMSEILSGNE